MYRYEISDIGLDIIDNLKVIIGADFVPTDSNKNLMEAKALKELFGKELLELLNLANFRIFNLEVPITVSNQKIKKNGSPNLKTYPESVNTFAELRPLLLSGANNHIFDFGEKGLEDTIETLEANDILYVGFGKDYNNVKKFVKKQIGKVVLGIYSVAENEYSVASVLHGGANGFDIYNTFDEIEKYKEQCDYFIVLFHGGCENYRYPTPNQVKMCRKVVDKGADLVICQHSHCIGTYERFKDGTIIYGQGNFLFDRLEIDEWQTSVLVEVDFEKRKVNLIPIKRVKNKVCIAEDVEAKNIISLLEKRSEECKEEQVIISKWQEFARKQKNILLLRGVLGIKSPVLLALNKITHGKLTDFLLNEKHRNLLLNYLRCESISERILYLLEDNK